jgi:hypothetical protein
LFSGLDDLVEDAEFIQHSQPVAFETELVADISLFGGFIDDDRLDAALAKKPGECETTDPTPDDQHLYLSRTVPSNSPAAPGGPVRPSIGA